MANDVVAQAPGRVNLIGDHTDYNDGFVLPMALPFKTVISASLRADNEVHLISPGYGTAVFSLTDDPSTVDSWARYVAAMAHLLAREGIETNGFDASIATDIPIGAGLSSSAALEVAAGYAIAGLTGIEPDPVSIARLGQRVENEFIGIQSGIMDQLISAGASAGGPTLIDCRSLALTPTELPHAAQVIIMDTMTRRELATSAYDDRRHSCERAAAALGLSRLRDATLADLDRISDLEDRHRAHHVVAENQRVLDGVTALGASDLEAFGSAMRASHSSLRDLYEVSAPSLDAMVMIADAQPGCFGARMTGGGFAGCAVALVKRDAVTDFLRNVELGYLSETGIAPDLWAVDPSPGASVTFGGGLR